MSEPADKFIEELEEHGYETVQRLYVEGAYGGHEPEAVIKWLEEKRAEKESKDNRRWWVLVLIGIASVIVSVWGVWRSY